jgi:hypothetical protein
VSRPTQSAYDFVKTIAPHTVETAPQVAICGIVLVHKRLGNATVTLAQTASLSVTI